MRPSDRLTQLLLWWEDGCLHGYLHLDSLMLLLLFDINTGPEKELRKFLHHLGFNLWLVAVETDEKQLSVVRIDGWLFTASFSSSFCLISSICLQSRFSSHWHHFLFFLLLYFSFSFLLFACDRFPQAWVFVEQEHCCFEHIYTHTHTHAYLHTHARGKFIQALTWWLCVRVCVCMYVCERKGGEYMSLRRKCVLFVSLLSYHQYGLVKMVVQSEEPVFSSCPVLPPCGYTSSLLLLSPLQNRNSKKVTTHAGYQPTFAENHLLK